MRTLLEKFARACCGRSTDDGGFAMVTVVIVGTLVASLSVLMVNNSLAELDRSSASVRRSGAFQAAEAGIDDYVSKLTEDHSYYLHFVHAAESTRHPTTGADIAAGQPWTGTNVWTYPNQKNAWRTPDGGDGDYEYNLQVKPPTLGNPLVQITATGRRKGSTAEVRAIEAHVRPASIADFQMIADNNITYGSDATTKGKIYAGKDEQSSKKYDVTHHGTAHAHIYAEGKVDGNTKLKDGATKYGSATIRSVIKNPIKFSAFSPITDIRSVAQHSGVFLDNDPSIDAWRMTFNAAGTVTIEKCKKAKAKDKLEYIEPSCSAHATVAVPAIGAIYAHQSVIVSGQVKGRVTVATKFEIIVKGNISYVTPGTDVLGLIAETNMWIAAYAPTNLTWSAATLALTGRWASPEHENEPSQTSKKDVMTFTGSSATKQGGQMAMYKVRNYNYDPNLAFLQPPYFPVLEEAYSVVFFREVTP